MIAKLIQHMSIKYISIEKYFFASGRFFSHNVFEIKALHQFPIINQKDAKIIMTGNVKFTAVKASFPTKFDTKNPSTTQ